MKIMNDVVKLTLLCDSGISCTNTSSQDYVKSCKESILANNCIAKTS